MSDFTRFWSGLIGFCLGGIAPIVIVLLKTEWRPNGTMLVAAMVMAWTLGCLNGLGILARIFGGK